MVFSNETAEYIVEDKGIHFNEKLELNKNEIILDIQIYNELFNENLEIVDIKDFVGGQKVHLKLYNNEEECYIDEEFTIVKLNQSANYISQEYVGQIYEKNFYHNGVLITGSDLGSYITYAIDNDLCVDSSKLDVVNKAISVLKVFEELFSL